jgi:hypothetical protein
MKYEITFATQKPEAVRTKASASGLTMDKKELPGVVYSTGEHFTLLKVGSNCKKDFPVIEALCKEFRFKQ